MTDSFFLFNYISQLLGLLASIESDFALLKYQGLLYFVNYIGHCIQ